MLADVESASSALLFDAFTLHYCILNFVPVVVFKSSKFPFWFSKDFKNIVFSRKVVHAKYKASRCPSDYNKFSNLCAQYKFHYNKCYKTFLMRIEDMLKLKARFF